uniref:Retrotransposon gag domain-containing protein n=1 Tax=Fagus sylvatica TaxID=28930 RepID=A0A2N9IJV0_FAGSY
MAEEKGAQPEAPRMTMYQLLHPTRSSIPSCIMFPPNAPHVEIKQGLMAILPDFKGLENENPYVHVRAFEEVIGSFYAQNVIKTAKLRFFPFSLKDKAKGWLYTVKPRSIESQGEMTQEFYKKFFFPHKVQQVKRKISNFAQGNDETLFMAWERFKDTYNFCPTHGYDTWRLETEDAMDYFDEIVENSNPWNGPSPLDSKDRNRSSITTSGGSVFRLREEDNMNAKISLLTKEIEALKLKRNRGVNAVYREDLMEACRICQEIGYTTSACKSLSQFLNVLEEQTSLRKVKSITILRSGKEIGKDAPKANEKSKETPAEKDESGIAKSNDIEKCPFPTPFPQALKLPKNLDVTSEILEHLHQVKVNLSLLHFIKQMPLYAKVIKDLCTVKRKHHVKKTAFLTEQVSAIIQHKVPPKYKDSGCPTISYTIGDYNIERALLDLGASVNLLSFSVYLQLRPFFATVNALINCKNGRMKITFGSMTTELNIFNVYHLHPVEPHATSAVEVPSKESVDQEVEKAGEKTKFFEKHKTKRKVLQDTRLSKKLLNSSKGVALHVARMKSARGSNYSFGGSCSGG